MFASFRVVKNEGISWVTKSGSCALKNYLTTNTDTEVVVAYSSFYKLLLYEVVLLDQEVVALILS